MNGKIKQHFHLRAGNPVVSTLHFATYTLYTLRPYYLF